MNASAVLGILLLAFSNLPALAADEVAPRDLVNRCMRGALDPHADRYGLSEDEYPVIFLGLCMLREGYRVKDGGCTGSGSEKIYNCYVRRRD